MRCLDHDAYDKNALGGATYFLQYDSLVSGECIVVSLQQPLRFFICACDTALPISLSIST